VRCDASVSGPALLSLHPTNAAPRLQVKAPGVIPGEWRMVFDDGDNGDLTPPRPLGTIHPIAPPHRPPSFPPPASLSLPPLSLPSLSLPPASLAPLSLPPSRLSLALSLPPAIAPLSAAAASGWVQERMLRSGAGVGS